MLGLVIAVTGPAAFAPGEAGAATRFSRAFAFGREGSSNGAFGTGRESRAGNHQYDDPGGIALTPSGSSLLVSDPSNNRVQRFTPGGGYLGQWGSFGFDSGATRVTAKGQFILPEGLAIDGAGNSYVVDSRNDRVQKFDPQGRFVARLGRRGAGRGQLVSPWGAAISGSTLYVVDRAGYRIERWSLSGRYLGSIGRFGTGPSGLQNPYDVKVSVAGEIYVSDAYKDRVLVFSANGGFLRSLGGSGASRLSLAAGLAIDPTGVVYVADRCHRRVARFSSTGAYLGSFGTGALTSPSFLALAPGGIYVADSHRVVAFAAGQRLVGPVRAAAAADVVCADERREGHTGFRGARLTRAGGTTGVTFAGTAFPRVSCPALSLYYCTGTISLRYGRTTIGRAPLAVGENDNPAVEVRLTRYGAALVRSAHRRVAVTIATHDSQGRARVTTATTTLVR